MARIDNDDDMTTDERIEQERENIEKFRREKLDPKCTASKADVVLASRKVRHAEMAACRRPKHLSDKADPTIAAPHIVVQVAKRVCDPRALVEMLEASAKKG
jgi:hypothetical protein